MAPRKNYTPDQLDKAIEAVKNGEKIAVAAKCYGVPRITLHDKLSGRTAIGCTMGPSTVLTKEEEDILEKWILALSEKHIPLTKDSLLDSVQRIIIDQSRLNPFTNNRPSKKWFQSFMKRHPKLTQRVPDNLSRAGDNVTENNIKSWFTEIESYLDENNLKSILNDPHRIFNADESAFFLSPKPGRVLAKKGDKHPYSSCGDDKDNLTVLITGNAAGDLAPPMIVFNYDRIPSSIAASVPDEWAIGKSESGWMCSSTFYEYITNVFNPWIEQNNIEKPVLFFVDGHKSHLTLHLSNFCSQNGIEVVALYPNSTHILQPMDLSVFRPLKSHWKKAVMQWKMENLGNVLRKENFAPVLQKALTNLTKDCVQNGFRAGGLFPFGPDYIDMSKIRRTEKETTTKTNLTQKEFVKYLESEIVNVFSAQKLQHFKTLYFENRTTLEREIANEDEALYLIWAKNKSEDALCHSNSIDAPTTSDTLEQARYPLNDVTTTQTNDVVTDSDTGHAVPTETEEMHFNNDDIVADQSTGILSDAGHAVPTEIEEMHFNNDDVGTVESKAISSDVARIVPTETEEMHFNNDDAVTNQSMAILSDAGHAVPTESQLQSDFNYTNLIETDSSAYNSKKSVDDNIGVTHSLPVAKKVPTSDEKLPSESISSTDLPRVIVEYLPQQLNYNIRNDAVTQPLPPSERSLPTDLSKDPLMQQPNNVPETNTVVNLPVLTLEHTSPIGSLEVTGDPQRQHPNNNATVNTLLDQALPPPNPSSSSTFPEVIGNSLNQEPIISTMELQYTTPQKKSLENVLGVIIPSPFKRSLFWPENLDSNKKRMKREKIPSTVTSKAWKEYHEKKEIEKKKHQQEKEERARQRIEKKKLKVQLTNEKKNKNKIKKTKKPVQEDSTPEESDVEISYAESDISYNLEDDEEEEPERAKIPKTKNQPDLDSIDSDLEDLPLSKIASSKANKPNKSRKFSVGKFVIIKYEGEYFPGKIESLRKNEYEISTMTLTTGNSFKWPNPPDKIFYKLKEIIEVIKEPICLNKRGFYRIPEMDKYLPNMYGF